MADAGLELPGEQGCSGGKATTKSRCVDPQDIVARSLGAEVEDRIAAIDQGLKRKASLPRPLDEAISVADEVTAGLVTTGLELTALPDVFVCGELLDWEAPTGGIC